VIFAGHEKRWPIAIKRERIGVNWRKQLHGSFQLSGECVSVFAIHRVIRDSLSQVLAEPNHLLRNIWPTSHPQEQSKWKNNCQDQANRSNEGAKKLSQESPFASNQQPQRAS
jgi:hypothetical protein